MTEEQANYQTATQRVNRSPRSKRSCVWWGIGIGLAGLIGLGILGAFIAVLMIYLPPKSSTKPMVMFNHPQSGARVRTGNVVFIDAFARDKARLQRIEFLIDGKLQMVKESSEEQGDIVMPLLTAYQPQTSGPHSLTLRAINKQGQRAMAMVQIEAFDRNDADNDGVVDDEDACPHQASLLPDGCPAPRTEDSDGDGLEDTADACPNEAGSAQSRGCPDPDGDGIAGSEDACPEEAGREEDGCPPVSEESNGDAMSDSGDREVISDEDPSLSPDEPIVEEDDIEEGGSLVGELGLDEIMEPSPEGSLVEIDVISFYAHRSGRPFDGVYCYYQLMDGDLERVPSEDEFFSLEGGTRYNLEDYLGGANSRSISVPEGQAFTAHVECSAYNFFLGDDGGEAAYFDLGEINLSHTQEEWNGARRFALSTNRPDPNSMFMINYRVCFPSCYGTPLAAPVLSLVSRPDGRHLIWRWEGDRSQIDGFFVYINGNRRIVGPEVTDILLEPRGGGFSLPPCGSSYLYQVSAFIDFNPFTGVTRQESPRSNGVSFIASRGSSTDCPYRVRITFNRLIMGDRRVNDQGRHDSTGPIAGFFSVWASNGSHSRLVFQGGNCPGVSPLFCYGIRLRPNNSYDIMDLFREIAERKEDACRRGAHSCEYYDIPTPVVNYMDIEISEEDELIIGVQLIDIDARAMGSVADVLFESTSSRIRGSDLSSMGEQTLIDDASNNELQYTIMLRSD